MTTDCRFNSEEWRPVIGYEGLYSVSSLGRVRSDERLVPHNKATNTLRVVRERILRQHLNTRGYWRVDLSRSGVLTTLRVHILVAEAFMGPRPAGQCVLHGRKGKNCNETSNLSYGSMLQNNGPDRIRDGTDNRGIRNGNAKLTPLDVQSIRTSAESHTRLARQLNVSVTTIYQIRSRQRWAHIA